MIMVECSSGVSKGLYSKKHAVEPSNLRYLAHCYSRADLESKKDELPRRKSDKNQVDRETKLQILNASKKQVVEIARYVFCNITSSLVSVIARLLLFVYQYIHRRGKGGRGSVLKALLISKQSIKF